MADLLGIGYSGLSAAQLALTTTGNNISNVNTPGYSRQSVDLVTNPAQILGSSYVGSGVGVASITRSYDQFLVGQVRSSTSSYGSANTFQQYASTVDNMLGDPTAGLTAGLDNYFSAVQQVANDPSSQAARQALVSQSSALASSFQNIATTLNQQYLQINTAVTNSVSQVNSLAKTIAQLNGEITSATGAAQGNPPNDLLDQRDAALTSLAQLVSVTTVPQDNGGVSVFIGNGQSLVVGNATQPLTIVPNAYDPARLEIGYPAGNGGGSVDISAQLSGGSIGGLLSYRSQMLDTTRNQLGQIAIGMASAVNTQSRLGMDLGGALGGDMFSASAPAVSASSANAGNGSVTASLVNAGALTSSDYKLVYNGANRYTLTRMTDGQSFAIDTGGAPSYTTATIDGISLTISAGAATGDSFLIQPTADAAAGLKSLITDPSKIAAAVPVAASASLSNFGTAAAGPVGVNNPNDKVMLQFTSPTNFNVVDETSGATLAQNVTYTSGGAISYNGWTTQISDGGTPPAAGDRFYVDQGVSSADAANVGGGAIAQAIVSAPAPGLTGTVTITFTSPNTFDVSGATTGSPTTGVPYVSGNVISYNGWNVTLTGTPVAGDSFTVSRNVAGVGDNGNIQQIAALQNKMTLEGGTATFQQAYGQIVAAVGNQTSEAQSDSSAFQAQLTQATNAVSSVSGVNLDEEAANMLQYQQAYQAAAKVIATANTLFQTLLSAVNGT